VIDTYRAIETPEGVELRLRVAGPPARVLAWAIDVVIRLFGYAVVSIPLLFLGRAGIGLFFLVLFLGEWFYPVLFEVYAHGATPGKKLVGLAVVHDDGTPVGWSGALLRNLLRVADFLPVAYGFGLVTMLVHPEFKRLGDMAAGTGGGCGVASPARSASSARSSWTTTVPAAMSPSRLNSGWTSIVTSPKP
jgi:uncharacterized RDD family membrane protein YckC